MPKAIKNTAATVRELLEPTIRALGYDVWDVEFVKEGADWFLRITIDAEDGIGIDDCEKVSRAVDPILDEADPIEQSYRLEVSSPGVERTIRTPAHIEVCRGEKVRVHLFKALAGAKQHVGVLQGYRAEENAVELQVAGEREPLVIPMESIGRMTTVFDFDSES